MTIRNTLKLYHRRHYWKRAGIVMIHVPKAAGTSLSTALYGRFLGHYSAQNIARFDPTLLKELPSFGVVRNPWDRCFSAYKFAQQPFRPEQLHPSASAEVKEKIAPFKTFESFLFDWLRHQKLSEADYIFQRQSDFLFDQAGNSMVSFTGHLEAMDVVSHWLEQTLGQKIEIGHLNKNNTGLNYRDQYDSKSRDLVAGLYEVDIRNFDYKF